LGTPKAGAALEYCKASDERAGRRSGLKRTVLTIIIGSIIGVLAVAGCGVGVAERDASEQGASGGRGIATHGKAGVAAPLGRLCTTPSYHLVFPASWDDDLLLAVHETSGVREFALKRRDASFSLDSARFRQYANGPYLARVGRMDGKVELCVAGVKCYPMGCRLCNVSGQVVDATGKPLSDYRVQLVARSSLDPGPWWYTSKSDTHGRFSFTGIRCEERILEVKAGQAEAVLYEAAIDTWKNPTHLTIRVASPPSKSSPPSPADGSSSAGSGASCSSGGKQGICKPDCVGMGKVWAIAGVCGGDQVCCVQPASDDSNKPTDPCQGETLEGRCVGDTAIWCEDKQVQWDRCSDHGMTCGYVAGGTYALCVWHSS
jgi:hypothetical protein